MTREEFERIVKAFMDAHTTVNLACSDDEGPWAAAVYYARRELDLVFFSSPGSRHSRAFSADPRAAGTIHGHYERWQDIKGLQLSGRVRPITSPAVLARRLALYIRRHPFVKQFFSDPSAISKEVAAGMTKIAMYEFQSERILYVNNEVGFGTRWTADVKEGKIVGEPEKA